MQRGERSYLIGAIDSNHNGEGERARRLIDLAVEAGLDAVKFQKRTLEKVWTRRALEKPNLFLPEYGKTMGEVFQALELTAEALGELRSYSRGKIDFLMAPFDLDSLRLAMDLEAEGLKIDPPCIMNAPFLKALSRYPKRIFVSVGGCNHQDIAQALDILKGNDVVLLHAVYARSVPLEESHLGFLKELLSFGRPVGYSDYGAEATAALVALSLGASVLEKPFTLYHHLRGLHHAQSLDAEELRKFVKDARALEVSLRAGGTRRLLPSEVETLDEARPGLFAAKDIRAGEAISPEMITVRSPGRGLTPHLIDFVVGRKAAYDIRAEEPITFGLIE